MGLLRWFSQVWAVTLLNLRTIGQRRGSSAAAVFGVAGVVMVFVAVLSIAEGFRATLAATGSPASVIVMRGGSDSEMMSGISRDNARIVADGPGVQRTAQGEAASAELYVVVSLPKRSTRTDANVPLRGVQPAAFAVRKDVHLVAGRMFQWGHNEVIAGVGAARQFAGLDLGSTLHLGENVWHVVGLFASGGSLSESEIWTDVDLLMPAYRRTMFQSVHLELADAASFDRFKDALTTDPRLDVSVLRETDYYAEQSRSLTTIITVLGYIITVLMAVGAVFGAVLTMYSAVASRTREIATLRALGFSSGPVQISVLAEAMVLALAGGAIGGLLAYFFFDGYRTSTLNWQSFSQVAFAFRVTPRLLLTAIVVTLPMGLIGGLFPAIRAGTLPVAAALRET
ncbi:MAG TPA: ABC transporter permease [Thermoanaerobaculia bacterium]|nr:ABC transporter permease [Thermoanaerobaculia bacterium]